jgi:endogenous inhibitor of DNA gyrase (YacG/DUF329 family)
MTKKKINYVMCPSCHKRINPYIGICICGYQLPDKPKIRPFRSYRPKKMTHEEWLAWIKATYGEEAYQKAAFD